MCHIDVATMLQPRDNVMRNTIMNEPFHSGEEWICLFFKIFSCRLQMLHCMQCKATFIKQITQFKTNCLATVV